METKEGSNKESCCSSHGSCGGCCGGKMIKALILLLLGGIIGYLAGQHCSGYRHGWMCPGTTGVMTPAVPNK